MDRRKILLYVFSIYCFAFTHLVIGVHAAEGRFALPPVEAFIAKWSPSGGSELGSSQSFLNELCDLMEVPRPASPRTHVPDNTYTFEKSVAFINPKTGKKSFGRIDLYKQGCFVNPLKKHHLLRQLKHSDRLCMFVYTARPECFNFLVSGIF